MGKVVCDTRLSLNLKEEQNQKTWLSPFILRIKTPPQNLPKQTPVLPISLGLQTESSFGLKKIYHFYLLQIDTNFI